MVSLSEFCRKAVGVNQQTTVHALSVASLHCSIGFPASLAPCGKFNKSFHNKSFHYLSLSVSVSVSVSIYPCTAKHNDLAAMSWLCAIHASLLFLPKRETARTSIMDCVKLPRCIKLPFLSMLIVPSFLLSRPARHNTLVGFGWSFEKWRGCLWLGDVMDVYFHSLLPPGNDCTCGQHCCE